MSPRTEFFAAEVGRSLGRAPRVGVIGATGLVGEVLLGILEERAFPLGDLRLFGSGRGPKRFLRYADRKVAVEPLPKPEALTALDLVFFAATGELSRELAPELARSGTVVIDKSATWRTDPRVPLVVPEINAATLAGHAGLIASPNCTTIGLVLSLAPLHAAAGLRRVHVTTLQAASGAGRAGLQTLERELAGEPFDSDHPGPFQAELAHNVVPLCDSLGAHGASREEEKLAFESRRILGLEELDLWATCVRVPVPIGHSGSVWVELDRPVDEGELRSIWAQAPAVRLLESDELPTPRAVAGTDDVLIGRLRSGATTEETPRPGGLGKREISFFQTSDNLRRGAATNAVRIAEELLG